MSCTQFPKLGKWPVSSGMKKVTAPNHYVTNESANLESAIGKQGAFASQFASKNLLQALAPGTGSIASSRYLLESMDCETIFANSGSSSALLILYDYVVKRDLPNVAELAGPDLTWASGVDEEGGNSTDYQIIGGRPFESDMFNQYYKVIKTTRVNLSPGSIHRHVQKRVFNKVIHYSVNENLQFGMRDVTCGTMFVYHGQPAHEAGAPTTISISQCAIDMISKSSYQFRNFLDDNVSWTKDDNLPTTFASGVQFVNEAVGQTQTSAGLAPGTLYT